MPEYLAVEAYCRYSQETMPTFLDNVRRLFADLGYSNPKMESWLHQLAQDLADDLYGSSLEPLTPLAHVTVNGQALFAKPIIERWTQDAIPLLKEPWLSLLICFETQTERQDLDSVSSFSLDYAEEHHYQPGVGRAVWSIIRQCASLFPESGIYFTNEGNALQAWETLATEQKGLWAFDLALIPHNLTQHFTPIPAEFAHIQLPEGIGFASKERWTVLPWQE